MQGPILRSHSRVDEWTGLSESTKSLQSLRYHKYYYAYGMTSILNHMIGCKRSDRSTSGRRSSVALSAPSKLESTSNYLYLYLRNLDTISTEHDGAVELNT